MHETLVCVPFILDLIDIDNYMHQMGADVGLNTCRFSFRILHADRGEIYAMTDNSISSVLKTTLSSMVKHFWWLTSQLLHHPHRRFIDCCTTTTTSNSNGLLWRRRQRDCHITNDPNDFIYVYFRACLLFFFNTTLSNSREHRETIFTRWKNKQKHNKTLWSLNAFCVNLSISGLSFSQAI